MPFPKTDKSEIDWVSRGVLPANTPEALSAIQETGNNYTLTNYLEGYPGAYPVAIVFSGKAALEGAEVKNN